MLEWDRSLSSSGAFLFSLEDESICINDLTGTMVKHQILLKLDGDGGYLLILVSSVWTASDRPLPRCVLLPDPEHAIVYLQLAGRQATESSFVQ